MPWVITTQSSLTLKQDAPQRFTVSFLPERRPGDECPPNQGKREKATQY